MKDNIYRLPFMNYGSENSSNWTDEDSKMQNKFILIMVVILIIVIIGSIFGIIH